MQASILILLAFAATIADSQYYGSRSETSPAGCYMWHEYGRVLPHDAMESNLMTRTMCSDSCLQRSMKYFGVADGSKCSCGDRLFGSVRMPLSDCNKRCSGDFTQTCGSETAINVLETSEYSEGAMSPLVFSDKVVGCYIPNNYNQVLSQRAAENRDMTQAICEKTCASMKLKLFGLHAGRTCYCGKALGAGSQTVQKKDCSWRCGGNLKEPCGSDYAMLVLRVSFEPNQVPQDVPATPLIRSSTNLWAYDSCLYTKIGDMLMAIYEGESDQMSHNYCYQKCFDRAAYYFGVMNGRLCMCSYILRNYRPAPIRLCESQQCSGNSRDQCGSADTIAVFKIRERLQGKILAINSCVQGSTYEHATCDRAYDGNLDQDFKAGSCAHSRASVDPRFAPIKGWWIAEMVRNALVIEVRIYNRADCCQERLNDFTISVDRKVCATHKSSVTFSVKTFLCQMYGKQVRILSNLPYLTLCEVQVFIAP